MIIFKNIICIAIFITSFSLVNLCSSNNNETNLYAISKIEIDYNEQKWEDVCDQAKGSVCQIISYFSELDPFKLFKSPKLGISLGSGFIINPSGFIITNFHVVSLASIIKMKHALLGNDNFDLEYIGGYPDRDIALLKLTDKSLTLLKKKLLKKLSIHELPFLRFGDSDKIIEAQEIATLGFPMGQENCKFSKGNVSGWQKVPNLGGDCIQTTLSMNPGNSGGAVLNKSGEVIGICVGGNDEADGINYIIPINDYLRIKDAFLNYKIIRIPEIGVEFKETTELLLSFLEAPVEGGIFISKVNSGSIGDIIGLKTGDILFECCGIPVDCHGQVDHPQCKRKIDLDSLFRLIPFGEQFNIVIFRKGHQIELSHTIYPRKKIAIDSMHPWIENIPDYEIIGGLVVCQLTSNHIELLESLAIKHQSCHFSNSPISKYKKLENRFEPRLLIGSILPGSQADESHCFETISDMIISEVNGFAVKTIEDFRQAVLESKGKSFLTIRTEGGALGVLSVDKIIEQEPELAARNCYKISKIISGLR